MIGLVIENIRDTFDRPNYYEVILNHKLITNDDCSKIFTSFNGLSNWLEANNLLISWVDRFEKIELYKLIPRVSGRKVVNVNRNTNTTDFRIAA